MIILSVISIFLSSTVIVTILFQIRNSKVHVYRMGELFKVADAVHRDREGEIHSLQWRLKELDEVSYNLMVFKFWKPLESFYPRSPSRMEQ